MARMEVVFKLICFALVVCVCSSKVDNSFHEALKNQGGNKYRNFYHFVSLLLCIKLFVAPATFVTTSMVERLSSISLCPCKLML